jgi:hypothetical protein
MRRRRILAAVGGSAVLGLAASARVVADAIADESGSGSPLIDESLRTVQALPEPGAGWERERPSPLAIDGTVAEEGTGAEYVAPDGESYLVHVIVWPDANVAAERAADTYAEWDAAVAHEALTFACNGPSAEDAAGLLATSPTLDADAVA